MMKRPEPSSTRAKVKAIHFEGKYYKTRGPLNVPRSPQRQTGLRRAWRLAARPQIQRPQRGDRVAGGATVEDMKDYREEVLKHAVAYGRDPSKVKTLFTCVPTIVATKSDIER